MSDLIDRDELKAKLIRMWNEEDDHDFANKAVWQALADAPSVEPGWIPVTERLPKTSEKVLVTRRFGLYVGDDYDRCIDLGYYYSNLKKWDTLDLDDIEVLAWMPLPEPYREVTE